MRLAGIILLALSYLGAARAQGKFTDELWSDIGPIYAQTLEHPFLRGLADGTLPRPRFQFYLIQDGLYLRAFAHALSMLAAKAPRDEWATTLDEHAASTLKSERQLHDNILQSFGVMPSLTSNVPMAPANYAYTNHLLAIALQQPFADGLAAVLPCYWIYWEVGKELKKKGSRDAQYQLWIDQYAGDTYAKQVTQILEMMNEEASQLTPEARRRLKEIFRTSSRYEWMFWDMAWREEKWQPAASSTPTPMPTSPATR